MSSRFQCSGESSNPSLSRQCHPHTPKTPTRNRIGVLRLPSAQSRSVSSERFAGLRDVEVAVLVNNVLGERYSSNGYTYGYFAGGARYDFTYLYPQAPTNVLASLSLRW